MTTIKLFANDQRLSVVAEPRLASGDKNSVAIQVNFSGEWKDYTKSAVFFTEHDKTVYEVLLNDGRCTVPHEVLIYSGAMFVGVRGVTANRVKTSDLIKYKIVKGAPVGDGTVVEPTADVYQQILARIEAGMLKGDKGDRGDPGVAGIDGRDGKSAYEIAVDNGFEGTEKEWLDSLVAKVGTSKIGEVALLASAWEGDNSLYSQIVSIKDVTENSQVDITPSVEQLVVFYEKDLTFVTENDGGVVTVYAIGQKPENDYTIQVTITEVSV